MLNNRTKYNKKNNDQQQTLSQFILNQEPEAKNKSPMQQTSQSVSHRIKGNTSKDPFKLAKYLRAIVCKNSSRKYYRFRGGRFYGGIAAADCIGCVLDCAFCWSYKPRCDPEKVGKFYTPKCVVDKLMDIANKNNYNKLRITGNEPTLCREHLLKVLEYVPNDMLFILETNGILLDQDYVKALLPFKHHLHVRVSLKGVSEEQFEHVTAMDGQYLECQFKALEYLFGSGISCNAAIMEGLLDEENIIILSKRLHDIDIKLAKDLELESLIMYPFIQKELSRRNLNENFKPK